MRTIVTVVLVGTLSILGCSSRTSSKPPPAADVDPWSTVGIGSVFESRTVTRLERPFVHQTEATTKQTLVARNDSEVSVKIEISEGSTISAQEVKVPLRHDEAKPCPGSTVTVSDDACTVPAGTFDCTRTVVEVRQGDATRSTETWMAKGIPVPIKSVVTNENMTTTTELRTVALGR